MRSPRLHPALALLSVLILPLGCNGANPAGGGGGHAGTVYYSLATQLEIHKLDLATGDDQKLPLRGEAPTRAPDGLIVYTTPLDLVESAEDSPQQRTIVANTTTMDLHTNGFYDPQVSPDGKLVVYANDKNQLFVVHRSDGTVASTFPLTDGVTQGYDRATWTPDGRIVVAGYDGNPGLYLSDAGLSTFTRFDPNLPQNVFANPTDPAVSPDGKKVAFVMNKLVYVVGIDGSNLTRLDDDDSGDDRYPVWSPDGTQIAYFSQAAATPGDMLIRPATGGPAWDVLAAYPDLANKITVFETVTQFAWR